MKRRFTSTIIGLCIFSVICIYIVVNKYYTNFRDYPLSKDAADWGTFGDYFGGILNPLIGIVNLVLLVMVALHISRLEDNRLIIEFIHKAYQDLLVKLDEFTFDKLSEANINLMHLYITSFLDNNKFLFLDDRNLNFIRICSHLKGSLIILKTVYVNENSNKEEVSDCEVPYEMLKPLMESLKDNSYLFNTTPTAIKYKEYVKLKELLIHYIQTVMVNGDLSRFDIIINRKFPSV